MTWQDRIGPAAYTSPGGTRLTFQYEDVLRTVNKKTVAFPFPEADGSFIQDRGHEGRKYPVVAFFSGQNYDRQASAFESLLLERGRGRLEHPVYGAFPVVPFGAITRRDNLVSGANQAAVEVTFWEALEPVYPAAQDDARTGVENDLDSFNDAAAGELMPDLDEIGARTTFLGSVNDTLDTIRTSVRTLSDTQSDALRRFNQINDSINGAIDTLIDQPLALAMQTLQLIQAPGRALESLQARLSAYRNLVGMTVGTASDSNALQYSSLSGYGAVSGSVVAVLATDFETQVEAIGAADELLGQFDTVVDWRESESNRLEVIDTGAGYQSALDLVASAGNYLIDVSFTLAQERAIVLDRERTIVDLCAQLYGDVTDERLNFLIRTNSLSGSDILELPRGRRILYYV